MNRSRMKYLFFFCCCVIIGESSAQLPVKIGVPQIINFSRQAYDAYNQNWAISQDEQGLMYFANSKGLLVFDGMQWGNYALPGRQIVRAVASDGKGKVYTGGFGEIGYWEKKRWGAWEYHSLNLQLKELALKEEIFWKILAAGDAVFFQSFANIYSLKDNKVTRINSPGPVMYLFEVHGRYFVQVRNSGLYELKDQVLLPLPDTQVLEDDRVMAVLPYGSEDLLVCTARKGLYIYREGHLQPLSGEATNFLVKNEANAATRVDDNTYVFGTLLSGIIITNRDGQIRFHLDKTNGLQNNTVLSLFRDKEGNIWSGLDKGIDEVVLNAPFLHYLDVKGEMGTVYSALQYDHYFYVGTNHGLFAMPLSMVGEPAGAFTLVSPLKGQVWSLKVLDGQLICGFNTGTYRIAGTSATPISNTGGGWVIAPLANHNGYLLQGTYNGLCIYEKDAAGNWSFRNHVAGTIQIPVKNMEQDENGNIWVRHAYKGIYRVRLSDDLKQAVMVQPVGAKEGLPEGERSNFFMDQQQVKVTTHKGIFDYDTRAGRFEADTTLQRKLGDFYYSRRIITTPSGAWWMVRNDNKLGYCADPHNEAPYIHTYFQKDFPLINDFETILPFSGGWDILCNEEGFSFFNHDLLRKASPQEPPQIREIKCSAGGKYVSLEKALTGSSGEQQLPYKYNNLYFHCSLSVYDHKYRFKFGLQKEKEGINWSDWTDIAIKEYSNLGPGNYIFHVKTDVSETVTTFAFTILRPWYTSIWAIIIYLLAGALLIGFFYRVHHNRMKKQRLLIERQLEAQLAEEQRKNEHQLLLLQQGQLEQDLLHKSEGLANSTISLIRKKEFLGKLKNEIKKLKEEGGADFPVNNYQKILKMLDRHIVSEDEHALFEEGFNKVHENFFRQLLEKYPELTPPDLRLAAYLKMNLSNKEIAPLLNISVRGLEIKRYRLRKKLNLETDDNLISFMMQIGKQ